jgi:DNA polymerase III epsilon subunit-like protein
MNFIFDIETSGLPRRNATYKELDGYDTARIVSISWVLTQGDRITEQSYFIIRPDNFEIGEDSIAIHGISQEKATEEGSCIKQMFAELKDSLQYVHSVISYNIDFDLNVLKSELYRYKKKSIIRLLDTKHAICCMKKARDYLKMSRYPKLAETYQHIFEQPLTNAHNAMADTINCFKCYVKMFPQSKDIFFIKNRKVELTPEQSLIVFAPMNMNISVLASAGSGKCHAKDSPILMFDGSIKFVQNIQFGDLIMGDDSTPRKVLSLGSGVDEMFEIIPEYGAEPFTVNKDHILCLYNTETIEILEISVRDFLVLTEHIKQKLKLYQRAIEFPEKPILDDPWLVGHTYNHIPDLYRINSRAIRLEVLAGLIDRNNGPIIKFEESSGSSSGSSDILYLIRSLGFTCYIVNNLIHILESSEFNNIPTRYINIKTENHMNSFYLNFTISPKPTDVYYGFTLDSNHRYVMGNFIVTHNTTTITARIKYLINEGIPEDHIMLTTFTRDSANDMKQKLIDILGYKPSTIVGTIDSISKIETYHNQSLQELKDKGEHARNYLDYIRAHPCVISKYKYLFVDEFQDINELQFQIIQEFSKQGAWIFAVGDDYQNIYSFRGSNIDYILNFRNYFPENSDVFKLTYNFRSTREIINFANAVIENNTNQVPKKMIPGIPQESPKQKPIVKYFENGGLQNNFVVSQVTKLIEQGVNLDEIVILSPLNQSLFLIEELLVKRNIRTVYLDSKSDVRTIKKSGHVCLCTIHKSKGLEWDHVLLTNSSDELIPRMKSPKAIEEDRRLFYVAITRAKLELSIYYTANQLAPYVSRYVAEVPSEFYEFLDYENRFTEGKATNDSMTMEASVTKLIENLDGDDYIKLKEDGIMPILDIRNIKKVQLYEPFNYIKTIEQEELYTDFGTFMDVFISREIAKAFDLNNSQDVYALMALASVILDKQAYQVYRLYRTHFKNNIVAAAAGSAADAYCDKPKIIKLLSKDAPIYNNHIDTVYDIYLKIKERAEKYKLALNKIPVFNEYFLPPDFLDSMELHLNAVSSKQSYKDVLDDMWEVSKCHAIVTTYRRRLLFMNIRPSVHFKHYEDLFKNIQTFFIDHIKKQYPNKNLYVHEELFVEIGGESICGELDLRIGDTILEYKNTILDYNDITAAWILQLLCYKSMHDKNEFSTSRIKEIAIFNPLKGWYASIDVSEWNKQDELISYLMQKRERILSGTALNTIGASSTGASGASTGGVVVAETSGRIAEH